MIRFVCGRSGTGKSEYIMNAIKNSADDGKRVILIVPEQQAVMWESRTARELEPSMLLRLEVLTFTRLADRVAREYGGFFHNCATKASKQLLMWSAIESVRGTLSHYGSSRAEKLTTSMMQAIKEFRTYRVTPSLLEDAANSLKNGERSEVLLSRKLSDIAMIYAAYDELLRRSFNDSEELPDKTAKTVDCEGFFRGTSVFIDSFYSVTPAQSDIIRSAMRDSDDFTLTFSCPEKETGEFQFAHIHEHLYRMRALAEKFGGYEVVSLDESHRFKKPALRELESGIWDFSKKGLGADPEGITVINTRDRYSEAEAAASVVCRLVRDGVRYSEIALIARNAEALEGITDTVLREYGIPHYTSRRRGLAKSPAAVLILSVLRVIAYGWRREDILSIVKTGLLPLDDDECDLFEKYIKMWRIRGKHAYVENGDWGMNPDGYKQTSPERAQAILDTVNGARRKICDPLSTFAEMFENGRVRADRCAAALYELLVRWDVPTAISNTAKRLREYGYTTESAECLRLWDALMNALDTLAVTIPDSEGDGESFAVMMAQVISATDSGTIPTGIDEIVLGSANMMRTENLRHVIILGAVDGEFPSASSDDGILSETDRVMLEGCGIELSDSGRNTAGMEMFWFYKAVSSASESVTVIVPQNSGQSACRPSIGVTRIRELFSSLEIKEFDSENLIDSVWAKSDLNRFVRDRGITGAAARYFLPENSDVNDFIKNHDEWYISKDENIPPEVMKDILGDSFTVTQTKLDDFAKCPFKYTASYTLGLERDEEGVIHSSDTGTFVHSVLEEFFTAVKDLDFPIPENVELELSEKIIDKYIQRLWEKGAGKGRQKYLLEKLRRSIRVFIHSLNEEFTQGLFRPWRFEQRVGYDDPKSIPSPVFRLSDGTEIQMRGMIDRIDVMREDGNTYIRVVDYKTGSKEFNLSDIYEGLNLQLLLYLFTVWKSPPGEFRRALAGEAGEIIPAGVLYFSAKPGEASSDTMLYGDEGLAFAADAVSRTGIVLSDKHIIEAMDKALSGKYAPVKTDKNGEIRKSASLADIEKFGKLYCDISDIIIKIGDDISGGCAGAEPRSHGGRSPCEYCDYKPVCRRRSSK